MRILSGMGMRWYGNEDIEWYGNEGSCLEIQWNLYIVDTIVNYNCHCPDCRGVLNSGVVLYRITTIGTVHIREVSLFQRCPQ